MKKRKERMFVALSGGVDSAVAALLLNNDGHEVVGVFMENWQKTAETPYCTTEEDRRDALRVAEHLGIPLRIVNFEKEYRETVLQDFYDEYAAGRTPNPDVLCNRFIKFGPLLDFARREGADALATGHYARREMENSVPVLKRGIDGTKDQSYFLSQLTAEQLAFARFPLGDMTKKQVRSLAKKTKIPVANKPDSQGICFLGHVAVETILRKKIPVQHGPIVTTEGERVGEHDGVAFYTVGQRRGMGIGGGIPYYVADKDFATNTLIVCKGNRNAALYKKELHTKDPHWINAAPAMPLDCSVMIRYRQPAQKARATKDSKGLRIAFKDPQRAVTPGQYAAFYDDNTCLGSAVIQ